MPTNNSEDQWTIDRVELWLTAKGFGPAVDFFTANEIYARAFLDIDINYLTLLRDKIPLSLTEKNRLAYEIQLLRQPEYYYNRNTPPQRPVEKVPLIPERKSSSNNEKVSTYVNAPFTPTITIGKKHTRTLSNTVGRHSRNENDGGWKLAIRRLGTEHQQSIHVTTDSDTFHSLQVTGMLDPRVIKLSILRKLGLADPYSRYYFFHENGKNPNIPLGDEELSHICQISDHSSTNRILVKHILDQYRCYHKDGTEFRDFVPHTRPIKQEYYNQAYASNQESIDSMNGTTYPPKDPRAPVWPQYSEKINYNDTPYHQPCAQNFSAQSPDGTLVNDSHELNTPSKEPVSLWAVPPNQEEKMHRMNYKREKPSLWAVPPNNNPAEEAPWAVSQEVPLWEVPPKNNQDTTSSVSQMNSQLQEQKEIPSTSLWAVRPNIAPQEEPTPAVSLWAEEGVDHPEMPKLWPVYSEQKNNSTSLWAVPPKSEPPKFGSENLNLHPSISNKTEDSDSHAVRFLSENDPKNPSVASAPPLEDAVENLSLNKGLQVDTATHDTMSPPSPSSPGPVDGSDEDNWAERPSVERLYKNIDKYLPGHDLDKEIIVSHTSPVMVSALPRTGRLQGHKKSIRNVANEAHRLWKSVYTVIRTNNNLIKRRDTKMWHRSVEQVKPGMKTSEQSSELPKSKKVQWVRGELIGKGSFGRVYHAFNVDDGGWIAVKQVDIANTKSDYANPQLKEMRDGLFREISLLEDLNNEYIVSYLGYDLDEEEGHINIFLEYVPGGSVASCLSKTGKFEIPLVQFLTRQILHGLAYLHNRDIMHRDIKAGNILLDKLGVCKITDFGLSKLSGQDKAYDPHSNNSVMRGTVFWMAPEVVKGTNYNAKIDIWSLGCTVIEMLTGSHPWLDLNMLAALYNLGKYQAPPIPEDFPEEATDFLNKCFTINPEERPTAEQLLSHPFVRQDPTFEFEKYMKKAEVERKASRRKQLEKQ